MRMQVPATPLSLRRRKKPTEVVRVAVSLLRTVPVAAVLIELERAEPPPPVAVRS